MLPVYTKQEREHRRNMQELKDRVVILERTLRALLRAMAPRSFEHKDCNVEYCPVAQARAVLQDPVDE